jgi:hypothetical protein
MIHIHRGIIVSVKRDLIISKYNPPATVSTSQTMLEGKWQDAGIGSQDLQILFENRAKRQQRTNKQRGAPVSQV